MATMLDFLLEFRLQVAWLLSFTIAILLSLYLAIYQGWAWWQWGLVGVAALLLVPLIFDRLLYMVERAAGRWE